MVSHMLILTDFIHALMTVSSKERAPWLYLEIACIVAGLSCSDVTASLGSEREATCLWVTGGISP